MDQHSEPDEEFWRLALEQQRFVQLDYPQHGTGPLERRTIQPLAYGNRRDGNRQLSVRCYQIEPPDRDDEDSYWPKTLHVSEMENVQMLDSVFEVPESYRENDKALVVIHQLQENGAADRLDDSGH